jgi:hypothetical protein
VPKRAGNRWPLARPLGFSMSFRSAAVQQLLFGDQGNGVEVGAGGSLGQVSTIRAPRCHVNEQSAEAVGIKAGRPAVDVDVALDGHYDLAASVAFVQIPKGLGNLGQRIRPVDDGRDLARLDEPRQHDQVLGVRLADERSHPLAHER